MKRWTYRILPPAGALIVAVLALAGCRGAWLGDMGLDFAATTDPNLLKVTQPVGGTFGAGETMEIRWESTLGPPRISIDLCEAGEVVAEIGRDLENTTRSAWRIPTDMPASNEYQIAVWGYHPQQGSGELLLTAFSEAFAIVRR